MLRDQTVSQNFLERAVSLTLVVDIRRIIYRDKPAAFLYRVEQARLRFSLIRLDYQGDYWESRRFAFVFGVHGTPSA